MRWVEQRGIQFVHLRWSAIFQIHLLQRGVMGVLTGLTRTLSWVICKWEQLKVSDGTLMLRNFGRSVTLGNHGAGCACGEEGGNSHLLKRIGVEKNPSEFNDFSRVLGDIDTVLIARRSNMDHNIAINVELRRLLGRHWFNDEPGSTDKSIRWASDCGSSVDTTCLLVGFRREDRFQNDERRDGGAACDPAGSPKCDGDGGLSDVGDVRGQLQASGGFAERERAADRTELENCTGRHAVAVGRGVGQTATPGPAATGTRLQEDRGYPNLDMMVQQLPQKNTDLTTESKSVSIEAITLQKIK